MILDKKLLYLLITIIVAWGIPGGIPLAFSQTKLEPAFPNLTFTRPVDFQHPGDSSNRLFVVEQHGIITVFDNDRGTLSKSMFLDITDRVDDRGNEEGLLGLAFHPNFESNGYFFVDYTAANPSRTVIARFSVDADTSALADPESELIILEVSQPYDNHNGGQVAFGPDGYLYIAFGDGGSGGDPQGNGQNRATLLGSIVRIDIDHRSDSIPYSIPSDNPFVGNENGYREEIYAYGLRNPWRFSFDSETGRMWAADVGQNEWEEVDIIEKGGNYGWNIMEGKSCYRTSGCNAEGLISPVIDYNHSVGSSITGGFVYRGKRTPELTGAYIYADYVSGIIWKLWYNQDAEPVNELMMDTGLFISSFGVDAENELYLCAFDGRIYRFSSTGTGVDERQSGVNTILLHDNYPNPFNASTTISFSLQYETDIRLSILDMTGQVVRNLMRGHYPVGHYSVVWNAGSHASGLYITRLEAGGSVRTGKLMLVK